MRRTRRGLSGRPNHRSRTRSPVPHRALVHPPAHRPGPSHRQRRSVDNARRRQLRHLGRTSRGHSDVGQTHRRGVSRPRRPALQQPFRRRSVSRAVPTCRNRHAHTANSVAAPKSPRSGQAHRWRRETPRLHRRLILARRRPRQRPSRIEFHVFVATAHPPSRRVGRGTLRGGRRRRCSAFEAVLAPATAVRPGWARPSIAVTTGGRLMRGRRRGGAFGRTVASPRVSTGQRQRVTLGQDNFAGIPISL